MAAYLHTLGRQQPSASVSVPTETAIDAASKQPVEFALAADANRC
jgi:hypothetical protein